MASSGIGIIESALSLADHEHFFNDEFEGEYDEDEILIPVSYSSLDIASADPLALEDPLTPYDQETSTSYGFKLPVSDTAQEIDSSGSDVEFIETPQEVIELSDDDSNECAELLKYLYVPDGVIDGLKHSSNTISMKLGEYVKNKSDVKDIITDIPNNTWILPWKVVSSLFRNPSLEITSEKQKSKVSRKLHKVKKENTQKNNELTPNCKKDTLTNKVKSEKTVSPEVNDNSVVSVIHFDTNKPPEFLEFTRSGRLKKKPNRLRDSLTPQLYTKSKSICRKKPVNSLSKVENEFNSLINNDSTTQLPENKTHFSEDPLKPSSSLPDSPKDKVSFFTLTFDKKPYDQLDQNMEGDEDIDVESNDTWALGISSDSEMGAINPSTEKLIEGTFPNVSKQNKNKVGKSNLEKDTDSQNNHNSMERKRRHEMYLLFLGLRSAIGPDAPAGKYQILCRACDLIREMEMDLKLHVITDMKLKAQNKRLMAKLEKYKKEEMLKYKEANGKILQDRHALAGRF